MKGREKCEFLRSIRKDIADKNGIKYDPKPCTHEGDCLGVCPACEHEAEYIMDELRKMKVDGKDIDVTTERLLALERDINTREVDNEEEVLMGEPIFDDNEVEDGEDNVLMGDVAAPDYFDKEAYVEPPLMGDVVMPNDWEEEDNKEEEMIT